MRNFYKTNKILFILLALFLSLRIFGLGSDITNSDAIRWHRRSTNFLNALKQNEYELTYQHYQPGVTLMWLNSVVKHVSLKYQETYQDEVLTLEHAGYYPKIHRTSKIVMVSTLGVLFVIQYFAISKLFNKNTASYYALLISIEPYLIGVDRWFHLTSFETFFAFTAFLLLLLWKEFGKIASLYSSAFLFVLAVYSKLTAIVITLPLLVIFKTAKKKLKPTKSFLIFGVTSLILFFILLPALWVEPGIVLDKFYNAVINAVGSDVRIDQLSPIARNFFYPLILGFKMSPFVLALTVAGLFNIKGYLKHKSLRLVLVYLGTYFVTLSLADKKIDRYALALFPPLILIASYHLQTLKKLTQVTFLTLSITFTIWLVSVHHPVYSSYYSPLFGGGTEAINLGVFENSGEYFAQAAEYLNNKGGRPLVAVPNNIDSFAFYYSGPVTTISADGDYIVWSHDIDRKVAPVYMGCVIETDFSVQDFTYLYIYNCTGKLL